MTPHDFRHKKLAYLIHTARVTSLSAPTIAHAQQDDLVEEVVVTGSYLRNSAFAQDTAAAHLASLVRITSPVAESIFTT